ncbi:HEAT repeat domain containing protein [Entamoeba marina]
MCNALLDMCSKETEVKIVSLLTTALTSFAFSIHQEHLSWDSYIPTLFQLTQDSRIVQQCISLDALGKSTTLPQASMILSHTNEIIGYLHKCLISDSLPLRLKAITFLSNSISFLETTSEGKRLNELYPHIWTTVEILIKQNDNNSLDSIFEDFQDIISFSKHFLVGILPTVSENFLTICSRPNVDDDIKESAMECILVLIGSNTKHFKKGDYVSKTLIILLEWLATITDDDVQSWLQEDTDGTLFDYAQDAIENLTNTVGGKPLRDALFNYCLSFLKMNDWPHRFAALSAFAQVIPRGKFIMKSNITELLQLGFNAVSDDHPLVVFSLLSLFEELLDTFPHVMIRSHLASVMKALILCVKSPQQRIQEKACFTLHALLENLEDCKDKLVEYLPGLVEGLLQIMTTNNQPKSISTALSSLVYITLLVTEHMNSYYQQLSTVINTLLPQCNGLQTSEMKGKMIELMSIYNSKLSVEYFPSIQEIIYNILNELFAKEAGIIDPVLPYVLSALCRLVDSPSKALLPNIGKFMDIILNRLSMAAHVDNEDVTAVISVTNLITEEKRYLMLTVKRDFSSFAERSLNVISPLLDSKNISIRLNACNLTPTLLSCIVNAIGVNEQVKSVYFTLLQKLSGMLAVERSADAIEVLLECMESIINVMGENSLDASGIGILFESFDKTLLGCLEGDTSEKIDVGYDDEDLDDEGIEMLADEASNDDWLQKMLNCLATICKHHLQTFFGIFNMKLFPRIMIYFGQSNSPNRCSFAVAAMGTVIAQGKLYHYLPHVGEQFINYMQSPHIDIAFNAILFVGTFAELEIPEFQQILPKVLESLSKLLSGPKNKKYYEIHSQIVTTLGQILLHNPSLPQKDSFIKSFIGLFPVTEGYSKLVEIVYDMQLKGLITSSNETESAEIIYRLTSFCADTIEDEECSVDTKKRIITLLKIWTTSVPQQVIQAVWGRLTLEQRGELTDLQNEKL